MRKLFSIGQALCVVAQASLTCVASNLAPARNLALCWLCSISLPATCQAQEITTQAPVQWALPAERLMIEQASELVEAGQLDEALRLLEKLLDEAEDRLVVASTPQTAATLKTQRYIPLTQWAGQRTAALLQQFPDTATKVYARQREPATLALAQLQQSKDLRATQLATRRFRASELGEQFQLFLSDLYLERGWGVAASQVIESGVAETRLGPRTPAPNAPAESLPAATAAAGQPNPPSAAGSLAAPFVWQQLTAGRRPAEQERVWQEVFAPQLPKHSALTSTSVSPASFSDAVRRLAIAAAMNPNALDASATRAWGQAVAQHSGAAESLELKTAIEQIASWPALAARGTAVDSFHPLPGGQDDAPQATAKQAETLTQRAYANWPNWSQSLEKFSANSDRLKAGGPRVAESRRATLPYFPVVHDGIVFVNEMTRIAAYDLKTGQPWPNGNSQLSLFDSELSAASYLPLGYPMIGSPRGTLVIEQGCLYARLGSPITGRIQTRSTSGAGSDASLSYLVGLDLSKQGSMLPGFPLRLSGAEFNGAEFDGPPLAWGDRLIVAVSQRDHVGLRRSLAAFDRVTGELLWKSGVLASGSIADGEQANLIAHQQLTLAGGRLYYNTHLGAIACLDPLSGETQWLVQYSTPRENKAFPQPNRYRYRDLTPCLLSAGMVYCAPQDAPEIFALDALTGELVWSTDDHSVADVVHLLGAQGDALIVSGDRLVWLDKRTGRVAASFPGNTTPIVGGALPTPRGLGRGYIAAQHVYWPTAGEIYVFSTRLPNTAADGNTPAIVRRLAVQPSGGDGVNVLLADGILLVASPSRLMAFSAD